MTIEDTQKCTITDRRSTTSSSTSLSRARVLARVIAMLLLCNHPPSISAFMPPNNIMYHSNIKVTVKSSHDRIHKHVNAHLKHRVPFLSSSMIDEDIDVEVGDKNNSRGRGNSRSKQRKPMGFAKHTVAKRSTIKMNTNMHSRRSKTYKEIKDFRKAKQAVSANANVNANVNVNSNSKVDSQTKTNVEKRQKQPKIIETNDNGDDDSYMHSQNTSVRDSAANTNANIHDDHTMKQRIHNINTIRSSRTFEEKKRSSDRLNKARLLLNPDSNAKIDLDGKFYDAGANANADASSSTNASKSSASSNSSARSKRKTAPNDASSTSSSASTSTTVPDTYWYNGNLQSGQGDYVTRWAQGVKVAEPLQKYDPISSEKILFRQPTKWIVRNIQIGFPLAIWAIGVASDVVRKKEEVNRKNRAKQLLETINQLGPAIIKGGQALASRSDLMPSEYLDQLQKLQDDVPRFENEVAFATVEAELGEDFDDLFELVEKEPIAAASIGQVYKARLRSNGDLVALKIQRPKCEDIIALDLYVLRWWSGVLNILTTLLNRDIDVQSIIDDFGELIYRELDYVAEAANAQRFSELYAGQVKDVFVPKVYSELTTSKVLTMEWVEGFRLTDSEKLNEYGLDRKKLVDTLVQCSLRQILGNGENFRELLCIATNRGVGVQKQIADAIYLSQSYQDSFMLIHMLGIYLLFPMVDFVILILE